MKAVILAAGEGTRLEPLTEVRPKPMIPIANRPLLEYVVEAVIEAGIDEIVLVVGYKRERIQSYFGDGDDWGVEIQYAHQRKQLGTGHAILQAESLIDDRFLVLNGDRIIESSAVTSLTDSEHAGEGTLMAVTRSDQPSDYGVVDIERNRVVAITEKPPRHATVSEVINAGVYAFSPDIFEVVRSTETAGEGELEITAALVRLLEEGTVYPVRYRGRWLDVSHLWDVVGVNASVLNGTGTEGAGTARLHEEAVVSKAVAIGKDASIGPNATVLRGTALGDNVGIGPNAVVANSVVLSDATIEAGAVVRDAVVGENARIGANTTVAGGRGDVIVDGTVHDGVRLGGVIGDNASIGGNVTLASGTIVGTRTDVESGALLDGRLPSGADVRRG